MQALSKPAEFGQAAVRPRSSHIMPDDRAGIGHTATPDFTPGANHAVRSELDAVADHGSEFVMFGVDQFAIDHHLVVQSVVPVVREDASCTDIDMRSYDGISHIAEVGNVRVVVDDAVFDFDGVADHAVVANGCGSADVGVRADLAVFTDDDVSFDHSAVVND